MSAAPTGKSSQYRVTWHRGCTDGYVVGLPNDVHVHLDASLLGALGEQALFTWRSAPGQWSTLFKVCRVLDY